MECVTNFPCSGNFSSVCKSIFTSTKQISLENILYFITLSVISVVYPFASVVSNLAAKQFQEAKSSILCKNQIAEF